MRSLLLLLSPRRVKTATLRRLSDFSFIILKLGEEMQQPPPSSCSWAFVVLPLGLVDGHLLLHTRWDLAVTPGDQ